MPQVIRGVRSNSDGPLTTSDRPGSLLDRRRVTFDQTRNDTLDTQDSSLSQSHSHPRLPPKFKRRRSSNRERTQEEEAAYYDSRAATQHEFQRRASTLQSYYLSHPDLLPQLPFTFRHGFKRWRLGGYIALMVFDACVVPIVLYYALTFGGNVQGFIVFAVVTAIWGGPTYVEFAIRSLRLIKAQRFYKPLGVDKRWAFDITNWILVLTISVVTALLIVGAAPHIVFLRVLSMPGPAILYCLAGPILLMSLYHWRGWKAPFRISSTLKGEEVLPGIYYIVEDIVAVNAGGGRPFREGLAARYKASPVFRKMIRDLSLFWSIPGLLVAVACTIVVVINEVPETIAYGIGWAVPFIWAGIWAAITVPWVRSEMHKERTRWEEETEFMTSTMQKPSAPPSAALEADLAGAKEGKLSESSTLGDQAPEGKVENSNDVHLRDSELAVQRKAETETADRQVRNEDGRSVDRLAQERVDGMNV